MEIKTKLKEWGNSIGLIVPKEIIAENNLKVNDEVIIEIRKKNEIMKLFGSLKLKRSSQNIKDEARNGWAI